MRIKHLLLWHYSKSLSYSDTLSSKWWWLLRRYIFATPTKLKLYNIFFEDSDTCWKSFIIIILGHRMTHKKRHACSIDGCTKTFSLRHQLESHIKVKHLNLESYECIYCDKRLSDKWSLDRHMKFVCNIASSTRNSVEASDEDELNLYWKL